MPDTMVKLKVVKRMTGVFHSNLSKHYTFLSLKVLVCLAFRYLNFCIAMFLWECHSKSTMLIRCCIFSGHFRLGYGQHKKRQ